MKYNENYAYEIYSNQKIGIVRYNGDVEEVIIPKEIDGLPVASVQKHAFAATDIIAAEVPENVEIIGDEAFGICEELETIKLPASLKSLGRGVFKGCNKLKRIVFPNGSTKYHVDNGMLYDMKEQAFLLCPPGLGMETVSVPVGTKTISSGAFYSNEKLKYVRLPLTLKKIESGAFLFTSELHMIELPPGIDEIEPGSFLLANGPFAEKRFEIYAFQDSVGFRYAVENGIKVHPQFAIVYD